MDTVNSHFEISLQTRNLISIFLGVRRCPGEGLAELETFLILANLLKSFNFNTPEGDNKKVGTYYKTGTGILRNPIPFYVVLENRC